MVILRRSFLPQIPELAVAAQLLSEAADALIAGDLITCARKLRESDLRAILDHFNRTASRIDATVHRQSKNPKFVPVPKAQQPRMPSAASQLAILRRDGFRCRFCETKLVVKSIHNVFSKAVPDAARQGPTNETRHFGIGNLTASVDHIIPYSRGGTNDPDNLVTACPTCNYGRGAWLLEEVEIENPFRYPPIVDDWDGLTRLIGRTSERRKSGNDT